MRNQEVVKRDIKRVMSGVEMSIVDLIILEKKMLDLRDFTPLSVTLYNDIRKVRKRLKELL